MDDLKKKWDEAAEKIDFDPMRSIRYGMALRYIRDMDRSVKILELGCGEGTGLSILHRIGFKNLTGVEISPERIKRARKKVPSSVELREIEDDMPLPYDDGSFDVVISLAVIEHTASPDKFVAEIARVLKKNGYSVISSDCLTWNLMQLLRLYKSDQPIDKAMPILRFKKIFKTKGLQLIHYNTFHLPERKSPLFSAIRGIVCKLLGIRTACIVEKVDTKCSLDSALQETMRIGNGNNNVNYSLGITRYLLNLIDDENVFFVIKN